MFFDGEMPGLIRGQDLTGPAADLTQTRAAAFTRNNQSNKDGILCGDQSFAETGENTFSNGSNHRPATADSILKRGSTPSGVDRSLVDT